jgi:hypothetical protein
MCYPYMLLAMLAKKFMKFFKSAKKTSKTPYLDLSKGDSQGVTQWKKERPKKSFEVIYIYIYTPYNVKKFSIF